MVKRIQATVSGRVHGVGYRYFTVHAAQRLGVMGTVRNTAEDVEVVAEGEESALEALVAELRQGPHAAEVRDVTVADGDATGEFSGFTAIA